METLGEAFFGCQTENFLLDLSVPPVRRGRLGRYELLGLCEHSPDIFGNLYPYLFGEEIGRQRTSLALFAVKSLLFEYALGDDGKMRYRSQFFYNGRLYTGFSVTDPVYRRMKLRGRDFRMRSSS